MKIFLALALTAAAAFPAVAAEKCPRPDAMNRQTKIALLIKASHTGYRDIRIVEDCGRYQVRATKDGVKTRVWYDPETLRVIGVDQSS
ncbi:MAG: PepSY domain-containing protein [Rhizobiaceae bacterium]